MVELVTTLSGHQDRWAHRFVGPGGTAIQKVNDFFFYYGREGDSRVALPGLVAESGCIHRGTYTSVTVIACARALGGTADKLEQFV